MTSVSNHRSPQTKRETDHRVLIVEDDPGDLEYARLRLEQSPSAFAIQHAQTVRQAMAALENTDFDAIILDLGLPDSQGVRTAELLSQASPGTPLIVLTGFLDEALRDALLNLGVHEILEKAQAAHELFSRAVLYVIERSEALAQRRQISRLLEAAPDAILIVDENGVVVFVNQAALRLFGMSRQDFVGESLGFSVRDGEVVEITIPSGARTTTCEMRVVPFEWEGRPAALASLRDVTLTRRSQASFLGLSESGIIGVVSADLNGTLLQANPTFLQMLRYSHRDLERGLTWSDLVPAEHRATLSRTWERLATGGNVPAFELELKRKDGSLAPVMVGAAMVDATTYIAYTADVSERRKAEAERMVAEAKLRESEEQLRQAQKMEAVGRLAGGIAHDFNNLLSVILSFTDLIQGALRPDDPLRTDVSEIWRAGERAAELTRQLLMFSRRQVLDPRPLDLRDVVENMFRMLERIVGEDIVISILPGTELGKVLADRGSVEQVIMNLVVNARDAMPSGGQLTIECADVTVDPAFAHQHLDARPGSYVVLKVSDTGTGMDLATQGRIFEPFFTTKEPGKGTGMGLSTVYGIIKQSGGFLRVESQLGQGSSFQVFLRRTDGIFEAPSDLEKSGDERGSETILIVEDDDQVRVAAAGILRRHGYQVLAARDAEEALLICQPNALGIDLLLCDVILPGTSGPDLAARLTSFRPGMETLYMSGYGGESVAQVASGHVDFLQKPFTPASLTRRVREVLDGLRRHPRARA